MPFTARSYSCGPLGRVRRLNDLLVGPGPTPGSNWVNVDVLQSVALGLTLWDIEASENNGDHVFVVGECGNGIGPVPPFYGVAVSTNGGVNWNIPTGNYVNAPLINLGNGHPFQWNEIVVIGPQIYNVSGDSYIVGSSLEPTHGLAAIAKSTDGGATYNLIGLTPGVGDWNLLLPLAQQANVNILNIDAWSLHFDGLVGVVGLENLIIKTVNGGANWLIMNDGAFLTDSFATPLPVGNITGIHISLDQTRVSVVGPNMVVAAGANPLAGEALNTWYESSLGMAPAMTPGIGWHIADTRSPNDFTIQVTGDDNMHAVGIAGSSTWNGLGCNCGNPGINRRATHNFVGSLIGVNPSLYNRNNQLWLSNNWVTDVFGILIDQASDGLNYIPTAVWTWYDEVIPPTCYELRACPPGAPSIITSTNLSAVVGQVVKIVGDIRCYTVFTTLDCSAAIPVTLQPGSPYPDCATCDPPVPPTCMQLVGCDGTVVIAFTIPGFTLNTPVWWSFSSLPGPVIYKCFRAFSSATCVGAITVTLLPVQPALSCLECSNAAPCTCPPGSTLTILPDGTQVCREDIIYFADDYAPSGCQMIGALIGSDPIFPRDLAYNQFGVAVYQDLSTRPWPVTVQSPIGCAQANFTILDNAVGLVSITNNNINPLWGDGLLVTNGRHNNAAIWNHFWAPTACNANPTAGFYGFLHCQVVTQTTTYFFATSGRATQLKINGTIAFENTAGNQFGTSTLRIFPITLVAGNYVFEMNGGEYGLPGICNSAPLTTTGFVWEIYTGVGLTAASLVAMTTTIQLSAVTLYSTVNESLQPFDFGALINVPYNHRCASVNAQGPQLGFTLDNCFANLLNPNANPNIYVCHRYKDVAIQGCCYVLTDCNDNAITYLTSTDLLIYAGTGQVITVAEHVGCFLVTQTVCGPITPPIVTNVQGFADCIACTPKCYLLTDCDQFLAPFVTNTDLSLYVGGVVNIAGSSTCWQVSLAGGCQGSIPVVLTASFKSCPLCKPVCYELINCRDLTQTIITSTNLGLYVGQFIHIAGTNICWEVSIANTCTGSVPVTFVDTFATCEDCDPTPPPPPPPPLRPRRVKPGYTTEGCDPVYTETVSCGFAKAVYDQMIITRYGVTLCCNDPIEDWAVKKQLLDLRALYDPELCKNTFDKCCPPCAMFVTITVFRPVSTCRAPTNMVVILDVPPLVCPPPTGIQVNINLYPTVPCICYYVEPLTAFGCFFSYTDCLGVNVVNQFVGVPTYICSTVPPFTSCVFGIDYMISATPGDCLIGTCGP